MIDVFRNLLLPYVFEGAYKYDTMKLHKRRTDMKQTNIKRMHNGASLSERYDLIISDD
jgi:hypothetical protein